MSAQNSLLERIGIHFHGRSRDRSEVRVDNRAQDRVMNRLSPGKSSGKLDYIDALRGIAALNIFFYHIYGTTGSLTKGAYPIEILPERFIGLTLVGIPLFLSSVLSLYACLWTARPVRAIGLSSSIFAGYSE